MPLIARASKIIAYNYTVVIYFSFYVFFLLGLSYVNAGLEE